MTTREAAEILGVAVRTVQLWVEAGVLPAWRTAGGHRRIARAAVNQLVAERCGGMPVVNDVQRPQSPDIKLLLVEGDPHLARLFRAAVTAWTVPVTLSIADNGFEALVRMGELQPDMVVTDLVLPGLDGFQMLQALKKPGLSLSSLRLLVVSALSADEIAARGGLPAGVVCFQKPVNFAKLELLVQKYFVEKTRTPRNAPNLPVH